MMNEPQQKGWIGMLLIFLSIPLTFFGFLAWVTPRILEHGGTTDQLFEAVMSAIAAAILVPVLIHLILKKFGLKGKKPGELGKMFLGYESPYASMTTIPSNPAEWSHSRALVPTEHQPLAEEDEEGDEYEDEDENLYNERESDPLPEEEDGWDEVVEENGLPLAENFIVHPKSLVNQVVKVIGDRRQGKSNFMAVAALELARWRMPGGHTGFPIIMFDTENEFDELARHFPRGVLVGSEIGRNDAPAGVRYHVLTKEMARRFAKSVLQHALQVVLNLKSYEINEAAELMYEINTGIEEWQQARKIEERLTLFEFLGEGSTWFPQNLGESMLSSASLKLAQNAFLVKAVRTGGKRGFALFVDCQKYAEIDKRLLQGAWRLVFFQGERIDQEAIQKHLKIDADEIKSLQPGESFVFCPQRPQGIFVTWRLCDVPLKGKSPTIENLANHLSTVGHHRMTDILARASLPEVPQSPKEPAPSLRETWQATERAQQVAQRYPILQDEPVTRPPEQRAGFTPPVRETEPLPQVEPGTEDAELLRFVATWARASKKTIREMERRGFNYNRARDLYRTAVERKLIEPASSPVKHR